MAISTRKCATALCTRFFPKSLSQSITRAVWACLLFFTSGSVRPVSGELIRLE
jgi:hypothetical protein